MLKWTASATKMPQDTPVAQRRTPRSTDAKRRRRRATIANKENIPILTSTPMVARNSRNSPLVLTPLADILNVTPEAIASPSGTPERRRVASETVSITRNRNQRRHSTLGLTLPAAEVPKYATTLPKFEEEYSPNAMFTGQQLALRGLLPDPFMVNRRYFTTPQVMEQEVKQISSSSSSSASASSLPQKRKLELDFLAIAQEQEQQENISSAPKEDLKNNTGILSNRMGDQTLDNLIDAILDSARKEEKKKKPRKSTFNLRRRTLLKNQVDTVNDLILSPSYAAGDDPCSDLSFLGGETKTFVRPSTPQPGSPIVGPQTPIPATPQAGVNYTPAELLQLPTPMAPIQKHQDSFNLATPPAARPNLKRRSNSKSCQSSSAKKYKVDSRNYFEVGLALPSIYV
ncbi:uncharacterized protein LOC101897066 [Musca domestica]|uniref:Uncharacterized protein LOC101897066 n=1 Tax=Musca domestica TaxID=7370 RepID=A0A9J7DK50_MUSDO|nr:uncharacterized protein LOC101897066 [Musca domestica]